MEFSWSNNLAASGATASVVALASILMRDWVLSFLRKEFGPWARDTADRRLWIIGILVSSFVAFLVSVPSIFVYRELAGNLPFWGGFCAAMAFLFTGMLAFLFRGWWLQMAVWQSVLWFCVAFFAHSFIPFSS